VDSTRVRLAKRGNCVRPPNAARSLTAIFSLGSYTMGKDEMLADLCAWSPVMWHERSGLQNANHHFGDRSPRVEKPVPLDV
jgi:hypothetical protein